MSLILSESTLPASSKRDGHALTLNSGQPGSYELMIPTLEQIPQSGSRGCKRSINLCHGLNLLIRDYWLEEVLIEENLPASPGLTLEFGFDLLGNYPDDGDSSGPNGFLQFNHNFTHGTVQEWCFSGRLLKIDLHLITQQDSQTFSPDQFAFIPAELQQIIHKNHEYWHMPLGSLTPNIQLVLQQILNCPYTGSIQQVYLEGKALELIALQSAHLLQFDQQITRHTLKRSDIERIHQARELVMQQLENPPSLIDLSRAVGLNDCTLKRGFRQVFGTTVFGYIRQQRLIKARQLLRDREMSVAQVACSVGYTHPGHFAAAFKREFGVSPKVYSHSGL
jgi:AraC family transcriptional regulator, transcriptional activator of the genes for pyochelin and ferripyochelin receptors